MRMSMWLMCVLMGMRMSMDMCSWEAKEGRHSRRSNESDMRHTWYRSLRLTRNWLGLLMGTCWQILTRSMLRLRMRLCSWLLLMVLKIDAKRDILRGSPMSIGSRRSMLNLNVEALQKRAHIAHKAIENVVQWICTRLRARLRLVWLSRCLRLLSLVRLLLLLRSSSFLDKM